MARLYIGNLPTSGAAEQLAQRIGKLTGTTVTKFAPVNDAGTGDFKGFAYVDILTHQAPSLTQGSEEAPSAEGKKAAPNDPVHRVIHAFNNLLWQGRRLRVERAQPDHLARHQQSQDAALAGSTPAAAVVDPVVVKRAARVAARKAKKAPTLYKQVPPEDQPCALRPGADGAVELKVRRAKGARVIKVRCDPLESSVSAEAAEAARLEALPPAKRAKQRANLRPRGARIRVEGAEGAVPAVDELDWSESEVGDWEAEAEERRRAVAQGKGEQGEQEEGGSPSTVDSDEEEGSRPVFVPRRLLPPKFRVQPLPSHLCNMRNMGAGGASDEAQVVHVVQAEESSTRRSASDSSPPPRVPSPAPMPLGLAQPIMVCGEEQGGTVKDGVSQPLPTHKRKEPPVPEADRGQQVERKRGKTVRPPLAEPEPVPPAAAGTTGGGTASSATEAVEDVHAAVSAERAAHLAYLEHLFGSSTGSGEQAEQGRARERAVEADGSELARVQEEARERAQAALSSTESTVEFNARPSKGQRQGGQTGAGAGKKRQREPLQQQAAGQGVEEHAQQAAPKAWRDLVYGETLAQAGRSQLSLHSALTKAQQGAAGAGAEGEGAGAQTWAGFKLVKDMVEEAEVKASLPAYARPIKEGVAGTAFLAPVRGPWKTWSSAGFKASSLFGDSLAIDSGEQQPAVPCRPVPLQASEAAGGERGIDNRPAWMKALDTGATGTTASAASAAPGGAGRIVPSGGVGKPAAGQWGAKPSAAAPQHRKPAAPAHPHSQPRPAPAVSASALLAAASSFTASFASSGSGPGGGPMGASQQHNGRANSYKQLAKQAHMAAQRQGHKGR